MTNSKYYKIYTELKSRIDLQKYKNKTLPKELELVKEFNSSRTTIRRALELLEKDGYISRKKKAGTFISPSNMRKKKTIRVAVFEPNDICKPLTSAINFIQSLKQSNYIIEIFKLTGETNIENAYQDFDVIFPTEVNFSHILKENLALPFKENYSLSNAKAVKYYYNEKNEPFAVPLTYSPLRIVYNKAILDNLKIDLTKELNWLDFKKIINKIKPYQQQKFDAFFALTRYSWPYRWIPLAWQNFPELFRKNAFLPDGFTTVKQELLEIFSSESHYMHNSVLSNKSSIEMFNEGQLATLFINSYDLPKLNRDIDFKVCSYPCGTNLKKTTSVYTVPATISKYTSARSECFSFIQQLLSPETQFYLAANFCFIPIVNIDWGKLSSQMPDELYNEFNNFVYDCNFGYCINPAFWKELCNLTIELEKQAHWMMRS